MLVTMAVIREFQVFPIEYMPVWKQYWPDGDVQGDTAWRVCLL